jgi:hypothetical protein
MFRIGGNTFYDRKNKIPMKIPEFKRSGTGLIAEFRGIPNGFPNQVHQFLHPWLSRLGRASVGNPLFKKFCCRVK